MKMSPATVGSSAQKRTFPNVFKDNRINCCKFLRGGDSESVDNLAPDLETSRQVLCLNRQQAMITRDLLNLSDFLIL